MTRNVVPFNSIGVKVIQNADTNFISVSVIGLRDIDIRVGTSGVGPESLSSGISFPITGRPSDDSGVVVDSSSGPKVSLGVLGNNVVEMIGFSGSI